MKIYINIQHNPKILDLLIRGLKKIPHWDIDANVSINHEKNEKQYGQLWDNYPNKTAAHFQIDFEKRSICWTEDPEQEYEPVITSDQVDSYLQFIRENGETFLMPPPPFPIVEELKKEFAKIFSSEPIQSPKDVDTSWVFPIDYKYGIGGKPSTPKSKVESEAYKKFVRMAKKISKDNNTTILTAQQMPKYIDPPYKVYEPTHTNLDPHPWWTPTGGKSIFDKYAHKTVNPNFYGHIKVDYEAETIDDE